VPMACFHANGSPGRLRFASKPTPIVVVLVALRGRSEIKLIIRVPPREISGLPSGGDLGSKSSQVRLQKLGTAL
jgi:hypothetical protein